MDKKNALIALFGYGYYAVFPPTTELASHANVTMHVRILREAFEAHRRGKGRGGVDRHFEVVDCLSGDHRIVAVHYAGYSSGGQCLFQLLPAHGERLSAGSSTAWNYVSFYKETKSQRAREAIDELFLGWENPPRWFFLAGTVAPEE